MGVCLPGRHDHRILWGNDINSSRQFITGDGGGQQTISSNDGWNAANPWGFYDMHGNRVGMGPRLEGELPGWPKLILRVRHGFTESPGWVLGDGGEPAFQPIAGPCPPDRHGVLASVLVFKQSSLIVANPN